MKRILLSCLAALLLGCAGNNYLHGAGPLPPDEVSVLKARGPNHRVVKVDEINLGLWHSGDVQVKPGKHSVLAGPDGLFIRDVKGGGLFYYEVVFDAQRGHEYSFKFTKGVEGTSLYSTRSEFCVFDNGNPGSPVNCTNELVLDTKGRVRL